MTKSTCSGGSISRWALALGIAALGFAATPAMALECLVVSNQHADTAAADLASQIPGITFDSLDVASYTPTQSDLAPYDVVLLFEDGYFSNAVNVGDALYQWFSGGGVGVVMGTFYWQEIGYPGGSGWGDLELVQPMDPATTGCEYDEDDLDPTTLVNHPITNGVSALYGQSYRGGTQLAAGATQVATWTTANQAGTEDPVAAYLEELGSRTVGVSIAPHYGVIGAYGQSFSGDFYTLYENALKWAGFGLCNDADADGYDDVDCGGDDCDDDDANVNPGQAEILDAEDQDCDGYIDEGVLPAGAVVVTEIMPNPSAVGDTVGEWFEVVNTTGLSVNLHGATVSDAAGDAFTVGSDLWILAGEVALLARDGDPQVNGGMTPDYTYGSWILANDDDEIVIDHFGVELDRVEYETGWYFGPATAMSLDPDEEDVSANDDPEAWCEAVDPYGLGDLGTPGDPNPECCPDADGDGYRDEACGGEDCDDGDAAINPDGTETACDYLDNDCDGILHPQEIDVDGDGWDECSGDCAANDPAIHPDATEVGCDGVDNNCDGALHGDDEDDDGDGVNECQGDCDDTNPVIAPNAGELACDYLDNNCDGDLHPSETDDDGDGFDECGGDCDDTLAAVFPGADEYCNGINDDCDQQVDEADAVDATDWYADVDADGYGDAAISMTACDQPPAFVADATDCAPADPDINPGEDEVCDGVDNDCDGDVDEPDAVDAQTWYADLDGDGFGDPAATEVACDQPPDFVPNADDCDDTNPNVNAGDDEVCDGVDNDCDGVVDEDDAVDASTWYMDGDGDGFGDAASPQDACDPPLDHVSNADDCDDADGTVYPGADETCDGIDNDCDGTTDEPDAMDAQTWYEDYDGDGYGDDGVTEVACDPPPGYVATPGDCEDTDAAVHPAAAEVCNGVDDDCDAATDENVDGDGDGFAICDGDCDDVDDTIHPDADEICNAGVDDDCDPLTDENVDGDGDFYTICDGDCDDAQPASNPGEPETCDGIDNDCDGVMNADEVDDDGDGQLLCAGDCDDTDPWTYDGAPEQCDGIDNDCDLLVDEEVDTDLDADGYNACQGDCDNEDATVYPGASEICDGQDNDCDGIMNLDEVDEDGDGWLLCEDDCDDTDAGLNLDDADGDGWTTCDEDCDDTDAALNLDDADGDGFATCPDEDGESDCDDGDGGVFPGAAEVCDEVDNDCDGVVDGLDDDGDGHAPPDCGGADCDDDDASVHPGADEVCDGVDNDCDGKTDDVDADGDGHPPDDCGGDDCDDSDPNINPDEPENCDDGLDNDCDGDFDGFDVECEDEGDDDDTTDGGEDCKCRNDLASRGPAPLQATALAALALLTLLRRRRP